MNKFENDSYNEIPENNFEEVEIMDDGLRQSVSEMNCGIGHSVNDETIGWRVLDLGHDWTEASLNHPEFDEVMSFLDIYTHEQVLIPDLEKVILNFSQGQQNILQLIDSQICNILKSSNSDKK